MLGNMMHFTKKQGNLGILCTYADAIQLSRAWHAWQQLNISPAAPSTVCPLLCLALLNL
jgi:hypothetical protein